MAFNRKNYVPYWKQFSEYIRFERAGNKCEKCGVPNYEVINRGYFYPGKNNPIWHNPMDGETRCAINGFLYGHFRDYELNIERETKIVLTVAHLDRWGDVCQCKRFYGFKCAKPSHVLALCQSCHLSYDRQLHLAVQKKNRANKKDAERALFNL